MASAREAVEETVPRLTPRALAMSASGMPAKNRSASTSRARCGRAAIAVRTARRSSEAIAAASADQTGGAYWTSRLLARTRDRCTDRQPFTTLTRNMYIVRAAQPRQSALQAHEGILDDILGAGPVARQQHRQPDQAQRMLLEQVRQQALPGRTIPGRNAIRHRRGSIGSRHPKTRSPAIWPAIAGVQPPAGPEQQSSH